jgi:UDP-2-acetamido-2,6-beta-L-arabino-hexul-4-ose reductase
MTLGMKKVLITGSEGFIGSNLLINLRYSGDLQVSGYDVGDTYDYLKDVLADADFVFHLAGVNRPEKEEDFIKGNIELTEFVVNYLSGSGRTIPLILASSVQAELDNPYGRSKLEAERHINRYIESGGEGYIYRLKNVFGKWCRPDYNSVVATFCHNIANRKEITISDRNREIELIHIDDIISDFRLIIQGRKDKTKSGYYEIGPSYSIKLGELADLIISFRETTRGVFIPDMSNDLVRKLHSTYLSYVPPKDAAYPVVLKNDERGYLFELLKSKSLGQIFISRTKPGVTRGNHFHHLKNEKFCVMEGTAVIKFRHLITNETYDFFVSGDKPEVVNILPGYTHSITNTGNDELITLFWANEPFDSEKPDTYFEKV